MGIEVANAQEELFQLSIVAIEIRQGSQSIIVIRFVIFLGMLLRMLLRLSLMLGLARKLPIPAIGSEMFLFILRSDRWSVEGGNLLEGGRRRGDVARGVRLPGVTGL